MHTTDDEEEPGDPLPHLALTPSEELWEEIKKAREERKSNHIIEPLLKQYLHLRQEELPFEPEDF